MKICLVGDTAVGKTSMCNNLAGLEFDYFSEATIGASFQSIKFKNALDNKLGIWDTAGQERYRSLIPLYSRATDIVILVICKDLSWKESLNYWLTHCENCCNEDAEMIIVFSKIDLRTCIPNADDYEYVHELLKNFNRKCQIIQYSSKKNIGHDKMFLLINELSKRLKEKRIKNQQLMVNFDNRHEKKCCIVM